MYVSTIPLNIIIYLIVSACLCMSAIAFVLLHVSFVAILYKDQVYLLKLLSLV